MWQNDEACSDRREGLDGWMDFLQLGTAADNEADNNVSLRVR